MGGAGARLGGDGRELGWGLSISESAGDGWGAIGIMDLRETILLIIEPYVSMHVYVVRK